MELALDWTAPWFAPVASEGRAVAASLAKGEPWLQALGDTAPVRFVPQAELPAGTAYEQFIFDTGRVPTRENLHDFFNGLCWRRFPLSKQRLNQLQAAQIAADGVREAEGPIAATLTAHHLLYNRNAIFLGGIRPHYYCLPVLKREEHRLALVEAATSGHPRFFLGTDSAPHPAHLKEHATGCAGCYTAHAALELYAEAFEAAGALDKLEAFASFHGPDFYGLPRNTERVTLERRAWTVPETVPFGDAALKPLRGGEQLAWRFVG